MYSVWNTSYETQGMSVCLCFFFLKKSIENELGYFIKIIIETTDSLLLRYCC